MRVWRERWRIWVVGSFRLWTIDTSSSSTLLLHALCLFPPEYSLGSCKKLHPASWWSRIVTVVRTLGFGGRVFMDRSLARTWAFTNPPNVTAYYSIFIVHDPSEYRARITSRANRTSTAQLHASRRVSVTPSVVVMIKLWSSRVINTAPHVATDRSLLLGHPSTLQQC